MAKEENNNEKKHKGTVDKIVMGAIIGTAIGSVLGMTVAPKKGSETRKMISNKTEDIKEVSKIGKETAVGFFKIAKRLLFGKKKTQAKPPLGMKKIPNEMEITSPENVDRD